MKEGFVRSFTGLIAFVFAFSFTTATVEAVAFDENFYSQNNIQFYSPACEETASSDGAVQLAGKDNTEKILNFFMRKGLSLAQSAGIVGNMMQESGLNPAIEQGGRIVDDTYVLKSGVGFGLVQWTSGGRQQNFMKYMKELGVGVTDLSGQLGFVWKEMSESYPHTIRALKASTNPVDAAVAMHGPPNPGYEASADSPATVRSVRGGNAQKVHDKYKDARALAGSTAGPEMMPAGDDTDISLMAASKPIEEEEGECEGDTAVNGTGEVLAWAVKYAWPDFKGSGFTKQKQEYTEAVTRASKAGRYIGGSNGNDCGGFVTTLVHDSGFDKNYNAGNGYTVIQEQWLQKNWRRLTKAEEENPKKVEGDVAINANHTYIYVGKKQGVAFNSEIASASLPDRSPMAGQEGVVDPSFRWYRKEK